MSPDRDRLEELAALVASGGASEAEERELGELVHDDAEAAALAAEFADAAAMLPESLEPLEPAPGSFARIQEVLRADAPAVVSIDRHHRRVVWMAATAMLAAAALMLLWWREHDRRVELEGELAAASADLASVARESSESLAELRRELHTVRSRYEVLQSPELRLATVSNDAGATIKIFVDQTRRRWLVLAFELPPLPADRDYQLWFLPKDGGAPVSGGLLEIGPDGRLGATTAIPAGLEPGKAAVSIEPEGGSKAPTLDQIQLIGELI